MAITPNWLAATSGQPPQAGQVNQFLGSHAATLLYGGEEKSNITTDGGTTTNTNGTYLAQSFATFGVQTAIGYVFIPLASNTNLGSNLGTTTVGLYANSGGAPTGSPIVSTTVTTEYTNAVTGGVTTVYVTVPLPATGLTPSTTYWIVVAAAGGASFNYTWRRSAAVSGASTSTNGTTWTAQAYGFGYQVWDQTATGPLVSAWFENGGRYTVTNWNTNQTPKFYAEYTVGQTAAGYLQSYRTFSYGANGLLTGVS